MKTFLALLALLVLSHPALATTQSEATKVLESLLAAQKASDYDAFVADADDILKAALTRTQFEAASKMLNARMAGGYELTPLGELNMRGYQVFLFRFRFKDGGDDILGTLSLKDGKVGGILYH